ncbi:MAG: L,D-transpeptidase family protein [Chthoniobacteraceae bacterium]
MKNAPSLHRIICLLLLSAAFFTGCNSHDPRFSDETIYVGGRRGRQKEAQRANFDNVSYWDGDHIQGPPSLSISLSEQRAYFYKGQELVGISVISTGREGYGTPPGQYKILQKDRHHKSSLYGDYVDREGNILQKDIDNTKDPKPPGAIYDGAKMPFFMRITGGVGMHEGFLPGYPASHGCIRMPGFMAEAYFNNVSQGTPVTIGP